MNLSGVPRIIKLYDDTDNLLTNLKSCPNLKFKYYEIRKFKKYWSTKALKTLNENKFNFELEKKEYFFA